jgi:hypothetical protein
VTVSADYFRRWLKPGNRLIDRFVNEIAWRSVYLVKRDLGTGERIADDLAMTLGTAPLKKRSLPVFR